MGLVNPIDPQSTAWERMGDTVIANRCDHPIGEKYNRGNKLYCRGCQREAKREARKNSEYGKREYQQRLARKRAK